MRRRKSDSGLLLGRQQLLSWCIGPDYRTLRVDAGQGVGSLATDGTGLRDPSRNQGSRHFFLTHELDSVHRLLEKILPLDRYFGNRRRFSNELAHALYMQNSHLQILYLRGRKHSMPSAAATGTLDKGRRLRLGSGCGRPHLARNEAKMMMPNPGMVGGTSAIFRLLALVQLKRT
jgi:hypothetical protein